MYQETLKLIDKFNNDAQEIAELSKEFFSSISIKIDHQKILNGVSIPTLDRYITTEPTYATSYSWRELSTEMLDLKVELLNKYNLWHEMSRSLIQKYLIDRLEAFDESYKEGRKYITLDYQPNKGEDTNFFYEFQPHLNSQQNIISSLSLVVKDVETKIDINNTYTEGMLINSNEDVDIIIDEILDVFTDPLTNSRYGIKAILEPFKIKGLQDEKSKNLAVRKQIKIALEQMIEEDDEKLSKLLQKLLANYYLLNDNKKTDFNSAIQKLGFQVEGSKVIPHDYIEPPRNDNEFIKNIEYILQIFNHEIETIGYKFLYDDEGKPEDEMKCQDIFDLMLKKMFRSRGIDLTRETDTRRGLIDFRASTVHCTAHIEIKKSTNPQLSHGLKKQLPVNMNSENVLYGFFIIFDFGEKNISALKQKLERQRIEIERSGDLKIQIIYVDAKKKPSASKVH